MAVDAQTGMMAAIAADVAEWAVPDVPPVMTVMTDALVKAHVKMCVRRHVRRRVKQLTKRPTRIVDAVDHFLTHPIRF